MDSVRVKDRRISRARRKPQGVPSTNAAAWNESPTLTGRFGIFDLLSGEGSLADAAVTWLLLATGACTVLVFGGRTAAGQATFLFLACITSVVFFGLTWIRGMRVRPNWIDALVLLALVLVALQIAPLPEVALDTISPALLDIFPVDSATTRFDSNDGPRWTTLSLAPRETSCQLGLLAAGWMLTIVARHHLRSPDRIKAILDLLTVGATVLAIFGIAQFVFGNGKFFWFYEYPYTVANNSAKASFSNANHFGQMLVLMTAWPTWKLLSSRSRASGEHDSIKELSERAAYAGCLLVLSAAIILSLSRGAMATFALSISLVCSGVYFSSSRTERKTVVQRLCVVLFASVLGVLLTLMLATASVEDEVGRNLGDILSGSVEKLDSGEARRRIWETVARGAAEFPVAGVGLGAHGSVYHRYWEGPEYSSWFTHAENGPIQLLFETGVTGVALLGGLLAIALWRMVRFVWKNHTTQNEASLIAIIACVVLVTNCCQSLADFCWYVPAIAVFVAVMTSVALGVTEAPMSKYGPRIIPLAGLLFTLGLLPVFGPASVRAAQAEVHWFSSLRASRSSTESISAKVFEFNDLARVVCSDPHHPEANEALAEMYLWMFDLGQERFGRFSLAELRSIVRGGGFDSREAVRAWLANDSVAGDSLGLLDAARRCAIVARRQRPMDIGVNIQLVRTNFVVEPGVAADEVWIEQLLRIAPESPIVHSEIAAEEIRKGDLDKAVVHLTKAFQNGPRYQLDVLKTFARVVPARELTEILELSPGDLNRAATAYRDVGKEADVEFLQHEAALAFEETALKTNSLAEKCALLDRAIDAHCSLGADQQVVRLSVLRLELGPMNHQARGKLANALNRLQHWEQAITHYQLCIEHSGNPAPWKKQLDQCRQSLADQTEQSSQVSGLRSSTPPR